jgi:predicted N-acetyltransferase YhbS
MVRMGGNWWRVRQPGCSNCAATPGGQAHNRNFKAISIVRPMRRGDISAGLRLCRSSGWNQLQDDWGYFLDAPDSGGMVAEKNGAVAGTVAFLRYGSNFSWLSMMLVDPGERRMGIGSKLMEVALEALASERCVRLDATPLGEPMYRRFGFVPEYELARAVVSVKAERFRPQPGSVRPMETRDLAQIFVRDREVFGADRSRLLDSFRRRAPEFAWVAQNGAEVVGYCFGRPGYLYRQLGPIVAESAAIARDLVMRCLSIEAGNRLVVDAPLAAVEWMEWLQSSGFEIERRFLRMRRGENYSPGLPDRQFAIAGPEFG